MGWREQTERSLDRYLAERRLRLDERLAEIDAHPEGWDAHAAGWDDDSPSFPLLWRVLGAQAAEHARRKVERCLENEEVGRDSPPEEAMFMALVLVGGQRFEAVYLDGQHDVGPAARLDESFLIIKPQAEIGRNRVDFLLTLSSIEPFLDMPEWPKGVEGNADLDGRITKQLVVECDGHDFHDRTKAQASHDRRRDRDLRARGLPVVRYTGSDIWRDCFECADNALELLWLEVMRTGDAPHPR